MSGCWVRFAAAGDPNGGSLPEWTAYRQDQEPYLEFGDSVQPRSGLLKAESDFFDAYVATKRAENAK
jgi:carboxylesterase type B